MVFCSIKYLFIRDVHTKFDILSSLQCSDIGENSDGGNSWFVVKFGVTLINKDCHNSRTSDDIDMKLRLLAKFDKRNTKMWKRLMMTSCQEIITSLGFFSIYDQFCAIQRLDSRYIVHYSSMFMNNLLSKKNWNQN